jgi:membrane protein implicated in regulation of membrane protease activity
MSRRKRKLVGALLLIVVVPVYAMLAVELSRYVLAGASWWMQALFFLVAGIAWAFPILPLIRWMERLTPEEREQGGAAGR